MYKYNKLKGLSKVNSKPKGSVQIDVLSDLHLEFHIDFNNGINIEGLLSNFIEKLRDNMSYKKGEVLIIAGDISHDNTISKEFISQLAEIWSHVLVIPGNHEWYLQNRGKDDRYSDLIKSLDNIDNVSFLMDKINIFEYKGVKIGGTIMFYNLNETKDYAMWKGILSDSRFLTREFIQSRNNKDIDYYNRVINEVDIFVSHVPIVNLDGKAATDNLFLNVDVEPIHDVLYISGHTHYPKNSVDLKNEFNAINVSYGYPHEVADGRKFHTTIFVN